MTVNNRRTPGVFEGLTRRSMRLLVRIYMFEGAPHGLTIRELLRFWCERSISWRLARAEAAEGSMEAVLIRRFRSEGLCKLDGSLHHGPLP